VRLVKNDWIRDLYYQEFKRPKLRPDEFYWENGRIVLTEVYHKRRGYCCDNGCRHCAYKDKK